MNRQRLGQWIGRHPLTAGLYVLLLTTPIVWIVTAQ